jgi:hypothetical protein
MTPRDTVVGIDPPRRHLDVVTGKTERRELVVTDGLRRSRPHARTKPA